MAPYNFLLKRFSIFFYLGGNPQNGCPMFLAILAASTIISSQAFEADMTPQEKKQTGVQKLSEKEKAALQNWIDNNYQKRVEPIGGTQEEGTLQENLKNGNYIRLSNGSLWNIHPKDTPITQGWITPVEITVTSSGNADYPFKLTNTLTGSSVRARKVSKTS